MQLICEDTAPADWDAWQRESGLESGFCQTTARARMHRTLHGSSPVYLSVESHGQRMAAAQLIKVPLDPRNPDAGVRIFCDEGPVLRGGPEAMKKLMIGILEVARVNHARSVRVRPPVLASWPQDNRAISTFSDFGCDPWLTSVIDISGDEDALFSSLERSIRKSIRKCRKLGITIHACQNADEFVTRFLLPYGSAKGYVPEPERQQQYREWWEIADKSGYLFLYALDPEGRVLATLGSIGFSGLATEIMSARTPESYTINASPQDLLHWESFCHHSRLGQRYFNLAGFNPSPVSEKELGIRRYKEKWPGEVHENPIYTRQHHGLHSRLAAILRSVLQRLSTVAQRKSA